MIKLESGENNLLHKLKIPSGGSMLEFTYLVFVFQSLRVQELLPGGAGVLKKRMH
jgi:hypothetical protein